MSGFFYASILTFIRLIASCIQSGKKCELCLITSPKPPSIIIVSA